jgi:hypothetical protein
MNRREHPHEFHGGVGRVMCLACGQSFSTLQVKRDPPAFPA